MKPKSKFKAILCIVLCFLSRIVINSEINSFYLASTLEGDLEWNYEKKNKNDVFGFESATFADINGDGKLEIIFGSGRDVGRVFCLDSTGRKLWSFNSEHLIFGIPCALDLEGDGRLEILVNSITTLYCLNHKGKEKWKMEIGKILNSACVADIDGDGEFEILLNGFFEHERSKSSIFCLNINGGVEWFFSSDHIILDSVITTDFDNDGTLELLFINDQKFYCLNHIGGIEWDFSTKDKITQSPTIADIDNDNSPEILFSLLDNYTYCLNHTGEIEWSYKNSNNINKLILADINADGTLEILSSSPTNTLYCFNHIGSKLWSFETDSEFGGIVVADLNNDNVLEIITDTKEGDLVIIDQFGAERWRYRSNASFRSSPCVADIDADGIHEIIIGGYPDYLYCFSLKNVISSGTSPWYRDGGSNYNTGNIDSDGDYIDDITEQFYKTNKMNSDTDEDGVLDGLEVQIGLDPKKYDSDEDNDNDGLTNFEELIIYHTSIFTADTDKDGRKDGWEVINKKNPLEWDNWSYLFGIYLLPIYISLIVFFVFLIRKKLKTRKWS